MTLKQKALLQTIAIFFGIILISIGLNLILAYASVEMLRYVIGIGLISFMVYIIYGVVLARLESQETLDKMNTKV